MIAWSERLIISVINSMPDSLKLVYHSLYSMLFTSLYDIPLHDLYCYFVHACRLLSHYVNILIDDRMRAVLCVRCTPVTMFAFTSNFFVCTLLFSVSC